MKIIKSGKTGVLYKAPPTPLIRAECELCEQIQEVELAKYFEQTGDDCSNCGSLMDYRVYLPDE